MNKSLVLLIVGLLAIGFVLAEGRSDSVTKPSFLNSEDDSSGNGQDDGQGAETDNGSSDTGNDSLLRGRNVTENESGLRERERSRDSEFENETNETGNRTRTRFNLSNGRNAEIKIMPETASQTAIRRLGLKSCTAEEGCKIELKEVGKGDEAAAVYEVETKTEGKFLGLFKTRAKVRTQVNAETGEVVRLKKPFLTRVKTTEE